MVGKIVLNSNNIIENPESGCINIDASDDLIKDVKDMWGIDLTNKCLLKHLKEHGFFCILANNNSIARSVLESCPTDEELDELESKELAEAKAKLTCTTKLHCD